MAYLATFCTAIMLACTLALKNICHQSQNCFDSHSQYKSDQCHGVHIIHGILKLSGNANAHEHNSV